MALWVVNFGDLVLLFRCWTAFGFWCGGWLLLCLQLVWILWLCWLLDLVVFWLVYCGVVLFCLIVSIDLVAGLDVWLFDDSSYCFGVGFVLWV